MIDKKPRLSKAFACTSLFRRTYRGINLVAPKKELPRKCARQIERLDKFTIQRKRLEFILAA